MQISTIVEPMDFYIQPHQPINIGKKPQISGVNIIYDE
jgi:hypothetical protein